MVGRIVLSVCVAVLVTLACLLLGALLGMLSVSVAAVVGGWLHTYSTAFGIIAGIVFYFSGRTSLL